MGRAAAPRRRRRRPRRGRSSRCSGSWCLLRPLCRREPDGPAPCRRTTVRSNGSEGVPMADATVPRTYPAGVSCWIDLEPPDAEVAGAFYAEVLVWTLSNAMPPDAPGRYLIATLDGQDVAAIASGVASLGSGGGWNTYFAVDDAD